HLAFVFTERPCQQVDRRRIAWRLQTPGRHLRLGGDEEVVKMPTDESCAGWLLDDDGDDILAVEVALCSAGGFLALAVIFWAMLELPGKASVRQPGKFGLKAPAGERARRLAHVYLGVVASAEAEQFQQFAAPASPRCRGSGCYPARRSSRDSSPPSATG